MRIQQLLVIVLAAGCGADSPAPSAYVEGATPDRLTMSDDTANDLTITVSYDDHDGDLGGGIAEVHDCRADTLVTMLPIPTIAPPNVVADHSHITGKLDLDVNDIGSVSSMPLPQMCADLGVTQLDTDTTRFCVILVDAAGHKGDGDCTATISLFQ